MKVTVLDTVTGFTKVSTGISTYAWTEGNWSCDCNRNLWDGCSDSGTCLGCKRFIVIAAEKETDDDYDATLAELNEGYPAELLAR